MRVLIFSVIFLASCAPQPEPLPAPLPTAEAEMVAAPMPLYFPIAVKSLPLVIDQRAGPEVCMAWGGQYLSEARRDFGAALSYNSNTWRVPSATAVPIVRSLPGHRGDVAEQLLYLKSIGWKGLVILANEPDMPDQDAITRPQDMAGLYWYAAQVLPDATFITPNTIDLNYLDEFLDHATMRRKDRVGLHIYQGSRYDGVHTWPGAWVARAESILARHGVTNRYWISEAGLAEVWPADTARRYAAEMFASGAEVVCVYTTNCGAYTPGCGWDLYDKSGALTAGGNALKDALGTAVTQAAYP